MIKILKWYFGKSPQLFEYENMGILYLRICFRKIYIL